MQFRKIMEEGKSATVDIVFTSRRKLIKAPGKAADAASRAKSGYTKCGAIISSSGFTFHVFYPI